MLLLLISLQNTAEHRTPYFLVELYHNSLVVFCNHTDCGIPTAASTALQHGQIDFVFSWFITTFGTWWICQTLSLSSFACFTLICFSSLPFNLNEAAWEENVIGKNIAVISISNVLGKVYLYCSTFFSGAFDCLNFVLSFSFFDMGSR